MRIAVMQPTYLPWIGYFGMIDRVDTFVLLDSVQFARRSWQQRNQIKTHNGPGWLTVPVLSKGKRNQLIKDVTIDASRNFPGNHIRAIEANYRKSSHFELYAPKLFAILGKKHSRLAELNLELIELLKGALGIETPLKLSSKLGHEGTKASLLVDLCVKLESTEYLSPPGSRNYLDESESFEKHGIPVSYFKYDHPVYRQRFGDFLPYMSVIDLLFNEGPESLSIIRTGYET